MGRVTKVTIGKTVAYGDTKSPSYAKCELELEVYPGDDLGVLREEALKEIALVQKDLQNESGPVLRRATKPEAEAPTKKEAAPKAEEEEEVKAPSSKRPSKALPSKKAPKKAAPKTTAYDRTNSDHKQIVRELLNENFPGWKDDEHLSRAAKEASKKLNGAIMLDADGAVLDSFQDFVVEMMQELLGPQEEADI